MKKSLIALAVLGAFAGAASAQSSVTVYGRVNLGLVKDQGVSTRIDASNGANRLGFRGVEDLGNGLKGTFNIEHRFSPESGGQDGTNNGRVFWQGTAKLGLNHASLGTVEIGRMLTAFQAPINATDPWGTETVGSTAVLASGYATDARQPDGSGLGRTDVITYLSPKFAGLTLSGSVGPKRSAAAPANPQPAGAKNLYALWLGYELGPLAVGAGYEQNRSDDDVMAILASYNLGFAKVMGGFSQVDTVAIAGDERKNFNVGVSVPVGSLNLKAGFSRFEAEGTGAETDKLGVGAEYLLSKRTYVYTTYGRTNPAVGRTGNAFDLGVNHNF
ncbi:porin [Caldimonas tepidiphila]|uniref:porin n=1 Tax=Caldimonas tepidiphila TaxID=2315841 RepID=UPI000E5B02C0|nr:porin [Caldimonas tepidiphila]